MKYLITKRRILLVGVGPRDLMKYERLRTPAL